MRINLDDTPGDARPPRVDLDDEQPRLNLDDDDEPRLNLDDENAGMDQEAPDGFAIRRDTPAGRRRRRLPRTLTPFQQRLIALALIVVIAIAGTSLAVYWRNVRSTAERIPASALSPRPSGQLEPQTGTGVIRPQRPLRAIGPTPDSADTAADRTEDDRGPGEGIH